MDLNQILRARPMSDMQRRRRRIALLSGGGGLAATEIRLSGTSIPEDASVGDLVGTFSIANAKGNWLNPITWSLIDDDGGKYAIDGADLEVAAALADGTDSIIVQADNGTETLQEIYAITVSPVDQTAPSLLSLSPADNATGVAITATLTATFDEAVVFGSSVDIGLYLTDDTPVEVWDETDIGAGIAIAGSTLTITPDLLLDYEEGYYVTISSVSIEDAAGNSFAGIAEGDWSFATAAAGDITPPGIFSLLPADDETDVIVGSVLTAVFDEAVTFGSLVSIGLYLTDDTPVETFDETDIGGGLVIVGPTLTINLSAPLAYDEGFYVLISAGSVQDGAGNPFAGILEGDWSFTTEEEPTVDVVSLSPADDAAGVAIDVGSAVITLNVNIQAGASADIGLYDYDTDTLIVAYDETDFGGDLVISGATLTIAIPALTNSTQYYITIASGSVESLASTAFAGLVKDDWDFTTVAVPSGHMFDFTDPDNMKNLGLV